MDTLPTEIINQIVKNLEKKDLLSCLTVDKRYYSIFINHLYRKICFSKDEKKVISFMDSLHKYTRTKEAAKYVRVFSVPNEIDFDNLRTETDSFDTLMHLPNVEELKIKPSNGLVRALAYTTKPILPRIKIFDFDFYFVRNKEALSELFYRFRSTLSTLQITASFLFPPKHPTNNLKSFIASFPRLDHLLINVDSELGNTLPIIDIFKAFPKITSLYYSCKIMKLNPLDLLEAQTFSNIKQLEFNIGLMTEDNVNLIKNSLSQLKKLKIVFRNRLIDEKIIGKLIQMKGLEEINITGVAPFNMLTVVNFMNQLNNQSKTNNEIVHNEVEFLNYRNFRTALSTKYTSHGGVRTKTIYMKLRTDIMETPLILQQIGKYLNILKIHNNEYAGNWNLEDINQRCPILSQLSLEELDLVASEKMLTVNSHLTTLTIADCDVSQFNYEEIASSFPLLQDLHLVLNYGYREEDGNIVKYIQLPSNNLRRMRLKIFNSSCKKCNMMVIKVVDNVWVKSWSYDIITKTESISEELFTMRDIKPLEKKPLFVFISSSIEDVIFDLKSP
ncbi:hypothetical protein BDB01DRAFT_803259 [Pilobolus umbonatus]|nr:hypothetical protein BDB01DRAFT_803259 [Pilobolus umbonatus]